MNTQPHRADTHEGDGRKPHLFFLLGEKILHDADEAALMAEERHKRATGDKLPLNDKADAQPG